MKSQTHTPAEPDRAKARQIMYRHLLDMAARSGRALPNTRSTTGSAASCGVRATLPAARSTVPSRTTPAWRPPATLRSRSRR